MKTIINKNERHILQIDRKHIFLTSLDTGEMVEVLNYTGEPIYWDVYGECFVYDSGEDIEYKYIGKCEVKNIC